MCGMRDEEGEEGRRVAIVARRLEGLSTRLDGPMPNVLQAIAGFVLKGCSHRLGVVSKGVGERGERGERGIYRGGETIESEMIALLVLSPFSPLHLTIDLMRSGLVYHACSLHWQVHSLPPSINSVSPLSIFSPDSLALFPCSLPQPPTSCSQYSNSSTSAAHFCKTCFFSNILFKCQTCLKNLTPK